MWWTLLLSLVPGPAQIHFGKPGRGILCFALFLFFLNGALVAQFVSASSGLRVVALALAGATWILAFLDALRLRRRPPFTLVPAGTAAGKIYERTS
jgi:hypothetical protein